MPKISIGIPSGGLVVDKPAEYIDERSIANCQNIQVRRNIVEKRIGTTALGDSLGEKVLGQIELQSGLNTYFVRVGPTKFQLVDKTALTWTDIANAPLSASEEDLVSFGFPLISNVRTLVYTNGVDNIRKYNGTGNDADLGGSPPKCKFLIDFKGYLVLAYVIDGDDFFARVQWSDTGDAEEWDPLTSNAGSTNLLDDSEQITGIGRFSDFLTIHKESSIYLGQLIGSGTETFRFTRKETPGAVANGSIQNLPDGTQIFLARDGFRLFNGVTSTLIGSSINYDIRDQMSPSLAYQATSVIVRELDEYWCGVTIGQEQNPSFVFKYNYITGQCYRDYREDLTSLALYRQVGNDDWDSDPAPWDTDTTRWNTVTDRALFKAVAFADADGNSTLRTDTPDDDGEAVDAIWDTKDFNIGDVDDTKDIGNLMRWLSLDVYAKGTSIKGYYSTNSGLSWTLIGSLTLESDYPDDTSPQILYFDVHSSKIRFRFRTDTAGAAWALKQFVINYRIRGPRK